MSKLVLWNTIYPEYRNDRLFDINACRIGQNLLLPNILLKEELSRYGVELHTFESEKQKPDLIVFNDIPYDTIYTSISFLQKLKYMAKRKYRYDALKIANKKNYRKILILSEPNIVLPHAYQNQYYDMFDRIYTWNDQLVDNKKFYKYWIPQPRPRHSYVVEFTEKKFLTLMASDKQSALEGELYSERKRAIKAAIEQGIQFDLYGYGWKSEEFPCYQGIAKDKLDTLSQYKFCICYENTNEESGYITEKIFDCFFSGVIPIYLGAKNITDYIPENTFIDFRKFSDYRELFEYLKGIDEDMYNNYLNHIKQYLGGEKFRCTFSMENYIKFFTAQILEMVNL